MVALIYTRYFEGLLEFKFEDKGNFRIITEEEINFAKKQCEKYPFKKIQFDFIPDLVDKKKVVNKITFKKIYIIFIYFFDTNKIKVFPKIKYFLI